MDLMPEVNLARLFNSTETTFDSMQATGDSSRSVQLALPTGSKHWYMMPKINDSSPRAKGAGVFSH
eukprot:1203040-Prorocentrum_lima.AAC.1